MTRGDRTAAEAWIRHVTGLYRRDLGAPPPDRIRRALDRPRPAADAPLIRLDTAARALLGGAQARFDAGDYQGGLEMARRAASSAAGSGDATRRRSGCCGGHNSWPGPSTMADAEREIGYVGLLEARYGAAEEALQRSIAAARELGDAARTARALLYRGMCESDRCDFRSAQATIELLGLRVLPETEVARRAYGQAALARVQVRTGRFAQAAETARSGVELARGVGAVALVPWAIVWAAAAAETLYAEAYTLGCEIGDPCWEALALRGLALIAQRDRRAGQARDLLTEAVACCRRLSDVYRWAEVVVLTDLLELDPPRTRPRRRGRSGWRPPARCRTCSSGCGTAPSSKRPPKRAAGRPLARPRWRRWPTSRGAGSVYEEEVALVGQRWDGG
jgi:hypothetical protein